MLPPPTLVYGAFPQGLQGEHKRNLLLLFPTRRCGLSSTSNLQGWHINAEDLLSLEKHIKLRTPRDCLCFAHFIFSLAHRSLNEYFCWINIPCRLWIPSLPLFFQGWNNHYLWQLKLPLSCIHHICKYTMKHWLFQLKFWQGATTND